MPTAAQNDGVAHDTQLAPYVPTVFGEPQALPLNVTAVGPMATQNDADTHDTDESGAPEAPTGAVHDRPL